jgi:hypothetical protein
MKRIADTLEISRSNQYTRGKNQRGRYNPKPDDEKYLSHIRKITDARPSYGYRRVTAQLNREISERVNHKRIYRIMRTRNWGFTYVPMKTVTVMHSSSLRKTKTDKKDAIAIARFLFLNRDSISRLPSTQLTTDLRDLARKRESFLKMTASIKNDVRRILQITFPELEHLIDVLGTTMLRFLTVFPLARLITHATPESLAQGFRQGDRRKRISVHSAQIIEFVQMSVATPSPSKELIHPSKIEILLHL